MRRDTARLDAAVRNACPILGVSVGTPSDYATVRVDYAPEATAEQRAAADAAVAAFDWSDAAQAAWEQGRTAAVAVAQIQEGAATNDPTRFGLALLISVVCDRVNAAFAADGKPKPLLEADIMADIAARLRG